MTCILSIVLEKDIRTLGEKILAEKKNKFRDLKSCLVDFFNFSTCLEIRMMGQAHYTLTYMKLLDGTILVIISEIRGTCMSAPVGQEVPNGNMTDSNSKG